MSKAAILYVNMKWVYIGRPWDKCYCLLSKVGTHYFRFDWFNKNELFKKKITPHGISTLRHIGWDQ